ncbi:MAG: hypothetical protein AAFP92_27235, partial [Bacteroidota bacterium]
MRWCRNTGFQPVIAADPPIRVDCWKLVVRSVGSAWSLDWLRASGMGVDRLEASVTECGIRLEPELAESQ